MAEKSFDQCFRVGISGIGVRRGLLVLEQPVDDLPGLEVLLCAHEFVYQMTLVYVRVGRVEGEDLVHVVTARCGGLSDQVGVREILDGSIAEAQPGDVVPSQKRSGQFGGIDLAIEQVGRFEVVSGRGVEIGDLDAGFVDSPGVSAP